MKRLNWISILLPLVVFSIALSAAPVSCSDNPNTGFLATVAAPGTMPAISSSTVTCGPVTFSLFRAQDASGGTTTGLTVNESGSTYDPSTGTAVLGFNPGFVASTTFQDIHLMFNVTSSQPISAADLRTGGSGSIITERLCTGQNDFASGICMGGSTQLGVLTAASGQINTITLTAGAGGPATTTTSLWAFKDIGKSAGATGSGNCSPTCPTELTSVGESFTVSAVPEPATFAMLGGGLLLFALARRKRA